MQCVVKMAEGDGGGRRGRPKQPKLTMEQYLDFIHSHKQLDLTVHHLNQIIDMHGFMKIRGPQKSLLLELVKSLELMDPSRSTLEDDGVSSDAFLSLDDVIKDLNELKWQECCVTSLQTLNSANLHHQRDGGSLNSGGQGSISTIGTSIVSTASEKPKKTRRKRRKVAQIDGGEDSVSAGLNVGGSETATCSPNCWGPRKKRTVKYVNLSGNGDGSVVNFGVGVAASVASAGEVQVQPSASPSPILVVDS
ncbi:uncharacterized protein LOC113772110 [Coffea eugenioides]|uniref:uncharacterized protein LOC113772110 n=1 Tax=Coffea eugenioides TaxID=49369 RepID=UPI000F6122AB|nr:uncharacterized protein LOC113772110 [Coffea eugenioides]